MNVAAQAMLRPLASIPRMPRMLSSSKVIRTPADLKASRSACPRTTMWRRTFERFGAADAAALARGVPGAEVRHHRGAGEPMALTSMAASST